MNMSYRDYDSWKQRAPEDDEEEFDVSCPVCSGTEWASPCSEACAELVEMVRRERLIRGLYAAAKHALRFARSYVSTSGMSDYRVRAVLRQVAAYRLHIQTLRAGS